MTGSDATCRQLVLSGCGPHTKDEWPPRADRHKHLFSPELAALISGTPPARPIPPITVADLIRHLDDAGIKRAAVLSTAYIFGQPTRKVENERQTLMADNDLRLGCHVVPVAR